MYCSGKREREPERGNKIVRKKNYEIDLWPESFGTLSHSLPGMDIIKRRNEDLYRFLVLKNTSVTMPTTIFSLSLSLPSVLHLFITILPPWILEATNMTGIRRKCLN